jgi:hypothetical protein
MASAETKMAVKAAKTAASASMSRARAAAGAKIDEARKRAKKQDMQTRGSVVVGIVGQHAAGFVAGQVHYKFAAEKPMVVAGGLLGSSLVGGYLAATSNSRGVRSLGLSLTGLGIGHVAIKSSTYDAMAAISGDGA